MTTRMLRKTLGLFTLSTILGGSSLAAAEVTMAYEVEYPIDTAVLLNGAWQCQQNDGQMTGARKQLELFVVGETIGAADAPNQWYATTDDPHVDLFDNILGLKDRLVKRLGDKGLPAERLPSVLTPVQTDQTCWKRDAKMQHADYLRGLLKWTGQEQAVKNTYSGQWISSTAAAKDAHFVDADAFATAAIAGTEYAHRPKKMTGVLEMKTKGTITATKLNLLATRKYLTGFLRDNLPCQNFCDTTGLAMKERIARMNACSANQAAVHKAESAIAGLHVFPTTSGDVIVSRGCSFPLRALETQITMDIRLASLAATCDGSSCTPASLSQFVTEAYAQPLLNAGQVDELYRSFLLLPAVTTALTGKTPKLQAEVKGLLLMTAYWMYRGIGELKSSQSPLPKGTIHDLTRAVRKNGGSAITDVQWNAIRDGIVALCQMVPVGLVEARTNAVSDALSAPQVGRPVPFNGHAGAFPVKIVGDNVEFAIEFRPKEATGGLIGPYAKFFQEFIHREADPAATEYDNALTDLNLDFP